MWIMLIDPSSISSPAIILKLSRGHMNAFPIVIDYPSGYDLEFDSVWMYACGSE